MLSKRVSRSFKPEETSDLISFLNDNSGAWIIRLEVQEEGKNFSKNINIIKADFPDQGGWVRLIASCILEEYRYYTPKIALIVAHKYYQ